MGGKNFSEGRVAFRPAGSLLPGESLMSPNREAFLSDVREYVRWCITNHTSPRVSEFACRLGRSRSAVTARFSRESPFGLGAALRMAQVEFAKELLRVPNLPLSKLAESCGFTNERSF